MSGSVRCAQFLLLLMMGCSAVGFGQEAPVQESEEPAEFSLGVSGGVLFVDPTTLNSSFTLVNTTLDRSMDRVRTVYPVGAHLRMAIGPHSYLVLRGEYIRFAREFSYDALQTTTSTTSSGSFPVTDRRTYTTIPFGLGVGVMNGRRTIEGELGFFYAFSTIDESGSMGPYGSFHSRADGSGWGLWLALRPRIHITNAIVLAPEFSGRFLSVVDFQDQNGRTLSGFRMDFRGVSVGAVLTITFSQ